jgi:hypothetical protein
MLLRFHSRAAGAYGLHVSLLSDANHNRVLLAHVWWTRHGAVRRRFISFAPATFYFGVQ